MKVNAITLRKGNVIEHEGKLWVIVKNELNQPGKGASVSQIEMRDIRAGNKTNVRFRTQETVERYCARTGRTNIPDIDFCLAYNMFRLAAIIQGVYARAIGGNASSEKGKEMGGHVEPLAQLAWSHAEKAGA